MTRLHYPNGHRSALRAIAGCVIGVSIVGTTACHRVEGAQDQDAERIQRVVYVSYVDTAQDGRGQADFVKFKAAVERQQGIDPTALSIDFVEAVGMGTAPIMATMRAVVSSRPSVIVASSHVVLEAAKALTQSIPILFMSHSDPIELGHVQSIAAPGVNRTGFTFYAPITAKSLELLCKAYPSTKVVGFVVDPSILEQSGFAEEIRRAKEQLNIRIELFVAIDQAELARVLRSPKAQDIDAWYLPLSDVLWTDTEAAVKMMAETRKPVMYDRTVLARKTGGLSYEARVPDPFGIWAKQLVLILHGANPATIPVERPSSFELAINLDGVSRDRRLQPSKSILKRADVIFGTP